MSESKNTPSRYKTPALIVGGLLLVSLLYLRVRGPSSPPALPSAFPMSTVPVPSGSVPAPQVYKQAGPAELAVVAPLKEGGKVADYTVNAVYGIEQGSIWVICTKDKSVITYEVALGGGTGLPPFSAGPYAVYQTGRDVPQGDFERVAAAFFDIIKANQNVPVPDGLKNTVTPRQPPAPKP